MKNQNRGAVATFGYQQTEAIAACFSCSQNKPLLSSSHYYGASQDAHLGRQTAALTIHAGLIVKPYQDKTPVFSQIC